MKGLYNFDLETFRAIHVGLHRDWLDPIFWLISTSGLGWIQVVLVLVVPLYFAGQYAAARKGSESGRLTLKLFLGATVKSWRDPAFLAGPLVAVIAFSGLVMSGVIKNVLNRDRPSNLWFAHPQESIYSSSYPSGHTTTSFAIAFMLIFVTWKTDRAWIGSTALFWALMVGFSRIYRGVHWPTDVLGGAFAGLVSAAIVFLIMRRTATETDVDDAPIEEPPSPGV